MFADQIRLLFDYTYWARDRLLAAVEHVTDDEFRQPGAYRLPSLQSILVHLIAAEFIWRLRVAEGTSPANMLTLADLPTLGAVRDRWQVEERGWKGFVAGLTDDALAGEVRFRNTRGQDDRQVLGPLLLHLLNHGTQHRSEAAVRLTELGHSPGDLDLIVYLRERTPSA